MKILELVLSKNKILYLPQSSIRAMLVSEHKLMFEYGGAAPVVLACESEKMARALGNRISGALGTTVSVGSRASNNASNTSSDIVSAYALATSSSVNVGVEVNKIHPAGAGAAGAEKLK